MHIKNLTVLLLLVFNVSFAQEKEELGTEVVNIVKPYSPTISDAFKVKEVPVLNDSINNEKMGVDYSIFSVPVASTFTPAKGKATAVEKAKPVQLFENYATLGFGNYANVIAELYSNFEISRTDNFGVFLKHNSSQGGIEGLRLDDKYLDTKLEGNYTSRQKDMTYEIKAGIEHQLYNWYGLPLFYDGTPIETIELIDSKQSYFGGFAGATISLEDSYFKKANASIRYLSDRFSSSEINITIFPEFTFPIADYKLNVDVDIDYLSGKFDKNYADTSAINYSFLNTGVITTFEYATEDLFVQAGFSGYLVLDSENKNSDLYIYPILNASYRLMEEQVIAYGGVDGGLTQNSYYNFKEENPFISPTLNIAPTSKEYNGFAGVKGKINTFGYDLKVSYGKENDKALFVLNPANTGISSTTFEGYEYGNSFNVVYDDVTTLAVFGEMNFETSKNFSIGIKGAFYSYDTKNQEEAWNLPTIEASLFSDFNITEKIYGGLSIFYVGERKDYQSHPFFPTFYDEITLDSYVDANLYFGYRFTDQLSFFIKGNNLFGDNYQKWANYPVQGIQVLGGATYKFDW